MSGLNELATYLAANGGGVVKAGPLPATPDTCSALRIYGGLPSDVAFGSSAIYRDWPTLQVISRGPADDQSAAYTQAILIRGLMAAMVLPLLVGGVRYYTMKFLQPPSNVLGQDAQQRYLFSFNVLVQKDPS